jgi:hypothetical protein
VQRNETELGTGFQHARNNRYEEVKNEYTTCTGNAFIRSECWEEYTKKVNRFNHTKGRNTGLLAEILF